MNKLPLVSILIPCYNHEKFALDCIQSILEQDYPRIEVIICDDGSQDDSWRVLEESKCLVADKLERYVVIQNEMNMGITKTLNRILQEARGKYTKIIASDDLLTKHAISRFVDFLETHPEYSAVVSNGYFIAENQHYPIRGNEDLVIIKKGPQIPDNIRLFDKLFQGGFLMAPATMMKRELYEIYGNYDESLYVEDWEFWLRITAEDKVKVAYIDEPIIYYRQSDNAMTSMKCNTTFESRRIRMHDADVRTIKKYEAYVNKNRFSARLVKMFLDERSIAIYNKFTNLYRITSKELEDKNIWINLTFMDKIKFFIRYIIQNMKWKRVINR